MARRLGVSEGTIRRRLARLLEDGVVRISALVEPKQIGYQTAALIGLQVDPARVEEVGQRLVQLPETEFVTITTGSYDLFISVNMPSSDQLATFLHTKVGVISGVRHTETFVILETKKRSPGPTLQA